MTFYVEKWLAHGPIRFAVSPRLSAEDVDIDPAFSTGAAGEFLRRRTQGYYFADSRPIGSPALPAVQTVRSTPFLQSLRGDGRGLGYLVLMAVGVFFVLLGIAVVARKGAAGWVEIILGTIMILVPVVITAGKRRKLRLQEEKERAEREERERRNREMLEAYTNALQKVREDPSDENLAAATRERANLEVPYRVWSLLGKRTTLQVGFEALARLTPARTAEVSAIMSRVAQSVGLTREDEYDTKLALHSALVWHLLADDRLSSAQHEQLRSVRQGLGIEEGDINVESRAIEQFDALRGISRSNLPREECTIRLQFHEYCVHSTRVTLLDEKGATRGTGSLFVTNKRVVVDMKKTTDVPLMQLDDVEVNVDNNILTIRPAKPYKAMIMQVERPIYTAALIDIASTIDERPRAFA